MIYYTNYAHPKILRKSHRRKRDVVVCSLLATITAMLHARRQRTTIVVYECMQVSVCVLGTHNKFSSNIWFPSPDHLSYYYSCMQVRFIITKANEIIMLYSFSSYIYIYIYIWNLLLVIDNYCIVLNSGLNTDYDSRVKMLSYLVL